MCVPEQSKEKTDLSGGSCDRISSSERPVRSRLSPLGETSVPSGCRAVWQQLTPSLFSQQWPLSRMGLAMAARLPNLTRMRLALTFPPSSLVFFK